MRLIHYLVVAVVCFGFVATSEAQKKKAAEKITYDDHLQPILRAKCYGCHNPDKKSSDLDVTTYATLMAGGSAGTSVEPGDLESSYLWGLVSHADQPYMPPKSEKLDKKTLDTIAAWIKGGALENRGSKFVRKKAMFDLTLKTAPGERPKVPPVPKRLPLQPTVKTTLTTAISAMATSPWAPLAAVAGQKQVLLYNTSTSQLVGVLPFPEGIPEVLSFSRNGRLLLAGGGRAAFRGVVVVWDVTTGQRVFEVGDEVDTVMGADISADQSLIVLGSSPKVVRVYSTADGKVTYQIPKKHTDWITACSFSPDGVLLATADRAGGLFIWEAETGHEYLRLAGHGGGITGLSWRADSNILATCGMDGRIKLWEMENGRLVKNWSAHGGGVQSLEFCRDGNLVSCGRDRATKLWNQAGGQIRAFAGLQEMGLCVSYCDESKRVLGGDWTGAVKLWNAADGKPLAPISVNPPKLQDRLAAATASVTSTQAAAAKAQAAYQAAKAAADKANADVAGANKAMQEMQNLAKSLAATIKAQQAEMAKMTQQQKAAQTQITKLQPVIPLLKETLGKGQQAAAKAVGDQEIAAAVQQFSALLNKRMATLAAATKTLASTQTALADATKKLAAAQATTKTTASGIANGKKRIETLTKAVKPAGDKAVAAKQQLDAVNQQLAAAQKAVERWKTELEFVQKLEVLTQRQAEYEALLAEATDAANAVTKAKSEIVKLNQTATESAKKHQVATAAVEKTKKLVAAATAAHQVTTKSVDDLTAVVPLLKAALADGQQAAGKVATDKDLAKLVADLKATFDKKVADLAAAKKSLVEKTAALQKVQQQYAAEQKVITDLATVMAAATKQASEKSAAIKQLEAKAATTKKAADGANQVFTTVKKEVDLLRGISG